MAGNNAIHILRGGENYDPANVSLEDGQPFYSKKTKKLYIGDTSRKTELDDVAALDRNIVNGSVKQKNPGLIAGGANQFVIGTYNKNNADNIFEIGNGTSASSSNAFEILKDGAATINVPLNIKSSESLKVNKITTNGDGLGANLIGQQFSGLKIIGDAFIENPTDNKAKIAFLDDGRILTDGSVVTRALYIRKNDEYNTSVTTITSEGMISANNLNIDNSDRNATFNGGVWIGCTKNAEGTTTDANIKLNKDGNGTFAGNLTVNEAPTSNNHVVRLSDLKESYLTWGGKALSGSLSPVDVAAIQGMNRFAFASAKSIDVEYSTNGGTNWIDYGATNEDKIQLVSGGGADFVIGKKLNGATITKYDKVRITLNASAMGMYTFLHKLLINITTAGADECEVKVEKALYTSKDVVPTDNFSEVGSYAISGWSGWNSIPINTPFGGGYVGNIAKIRLTFGIGSTTSGNTNALTVLNINGIGSNTWGAHSTMSKTGHLYDYDYQQNAIFPNNVKADSFSNDKFSVDSAGNGNFDGNLTVGEAPTDGKHVVRKKDLSEAIEALNSATTSVTNGSFLTGITLTNGKITGQTTNNNAASASKLYCSITFTPAEKALTPENVKALIGTEGQIRRGSWNYLGNGYIGYNTEGDEPRSGCPFGAIDLAGTTVIQANNGEAFTQLYITPPTATTADAITGEMIYYIDNGGTAYSPTWYRVLTNNNYNSILDGRYVNVGGDTMTGKLTMTSTETSIDAKGTIKASSFNATSDKRLKENFQSYKCKKSILDLPIYKFDFINGPKNQIGCIAQELQEICPEIVNEGEDGYLSIQENKIIYLLLDEVKQLKEQLSQLKNERVEQ